MEIVKELISCKICQNRMIDPIILPCGETICNYHVKEQDSDEQFKCTLCSDQHQIPSNGFTKNKQISKALETNIDRSILGKTYAHACENTEKLGSSLREYDSIASDKETFIYEFFSTLRNKMDLNVEQFRHRFDEAVSNHRRNIDEYEKECRKNMESSDFGNVSEAQKQLDDATAYLRALHLDKSMWHEIESRSSDKRADTQMKLDELKSKLLLEKSIDFLMNNFEFKYMINHLASSIDPFRLENDDKLESDLRNRLFDGVYSLQSVVNYKYVCAEPEKRPIVANRDRAQGWEIFQFFKEEDDLVSIKAMSNNHYWNLNDRDKDKDSISASYHSIQGINQKFRIIFTFFDKDIIGIQPASKRKYLVITEHDHNKPIYAWGDTFWKTSMFKIRKIDN